MFDENWASLAGAKAAYYAYLHLMSRNDITEMRLPEMEYTPQQMFWIALANNHCKTNKQYDFIDSHSPHELEIRGIVSNMKEFARDFNCKIGSAMNPENKCHVF